MIEEITFVSDFDGSKQKYLIQKPLTSLCNVCPEYRGDSWMNEPAESDVIFIINSLRRCFQTERVFLMGGSMGGTGALIFSTRHPELISGVCALCPATDMITLYNNWIHTEYNFLAKGIETAYQGSPEKRPEEFRKRSSIYYVEKLKEKPVAIIHGDDDWLISVEHSRNFVKRSVKSGIRIFYHEIRYGNHDSPLYDFSLIEKVLLWFEPSSK
jgi:dipeptidyl aminopeptidase/acylaminoacyl peptidase